MRGFRFRLVVTIVGLVLMTAVALGVGSFLFVSQSLRHQFADDAIAQAQFDIVELATTERLPAGAGRAEFEASSLAAAILRRGGTELFVDFGPGEAPFSSSFAVLGTPSLADPTLLQTVDTGHLGFEWLELDGEPYLLVGGRRPPSGPDFFIYFPASEVVGAVTRVGEALLVGGALLALVGVVAARAIALRVLRPVAAASRAAAGIGGGDLTVRVPVESKDEFGLWAESFNRMAASLQESVAALEKAADRERRFVADVSHELRTPLTALVGEASLLRENIEQMPAEAAGLTGMLVADVTRLRTLVEDLLEVSRLDAGGEPEVADFDVRSLTEAVISARCPGALLAMSPGPLVLRSDRRRVERILGNLLDNAARHGGAAGVAVSVRMEGATLVMVVADRGPGVPPEALGRLFDRFYKVEAARAGGGSGLGLAIARGHAGALGGDLTARARSGGGLEFEARLPVAESLPDGEGGDTDGGHTGVA
jgi:signal transduction histidine kinase